MSNILSFVLQPVEDVVSSLLGSAEAALAPRLDIPAADLAEVAADTANYTANGQPLTVDQLQAADKAIIDYVADRINTAVIQPLQSLVTAATKSAAKPAVATKAAAPIETTNPVASTTEVTHTVVTDGAGNTVDSVTGLPVDSESDTSGLSPNPNASTEQG